MHVAMMQLIKAMPKSEPTQIAVDHSLKSKVCIKYLEECCKQGGKKTQTLL